MCNCLILISVVEELLSLFLNLLHAWSWLFWLVVTVMDRMSSSVISHQTGLFRYIAKVLLNLTILSQVTAGRVQIFLFVISTEWLVFCLLLSKYLLLDWNLLFSVEISLVLLIEVHICIGNFLLHLTAMGLDNCIWRSLVSNTLASFVYHVFINKWTLIHLEILLLHQVVIELSFTWILSLLLTHQIVDWLAIIHFLNLLMLFQIAVSTSFFLVNSYCVGLFSKCVLLFSGHILTLILVVGHKIIQILFVLLVLP